MAERFDCALSTARAVSRSSAFGLLFKRRERAAYPGSTVPGFAWGGAIEERDLTVGGASRSAVYPVPDPVVGRVGGVGSRRGWSEGGFGLGDFPDGSRFVVRGIFRGAYQRRAQAAVLSNH